MNRTILELKLFLRPKTKLQNQLYESDHLGIKTSVP